MDSSDEEGGRLAFAVTQDDLEEEADAFAAQRKRRRTKDDAIYGIFADDDQPSDDDGAGRRGGRAPRGRSSLAASRPMAFVAASASKNNKRRQRVQDAGEDEEQESVANGDPLAFLTEHSGHERNGGHRNGGRSRAAEGEQADLGDSDDDEVAEQARRSGDDVDMLGNGDNGSSDEAHSRPGFGQSRAADLAAAGWVPSSHPTDDPFRHGAAGRAAAAAEREDSPSLPADPTTDFGKSGQDDESEALPTAFGGRAGFGGRGGTAGRGGLGSSGGAASAGAGAESSNARKANYSMFGQEGARRPDKEFGKWEKHTKGVGLALLQKMGYKPGQGLGRHAQGITRPVDVKVRRRNEALQETGERTEQSRQDFKSRDSEEEEEEAFEDQLQAWRAAGPRQRKRKPKLNYRTVEEVLQTAEDRAAEEESRESLRNQRAAAHAFAAAPGFGGTTLKIVDMTGPQTRTIDMTKEAEALRSDAARSAAKQSVYRHRDGSVPMPELQYNINILVDQAERDLQQAKTSSARDAQRLRALREDYADMTTKLQRESQHIERLEQILSLVERCENAHELGVDGCAAVFARVLADYPQEYEAYGLPVLATAAALPLMTHALSDWDPLEEPEAHMQSFAAWRQVLEPSKPSMRFSAPEQDELTGYEKLVWHTLLPSLRSVLHNRWEPRTAAQAVVHLLALWAPLLPSGILTHILDHVVLPRLNEAVEKWDPRTDAIPIHSWLLPWAPLAGDRLQPLYGKLRFKLAACLRAWHASDTSALAMLRPWQGHFAARDMATFLKRAILPKLREGLQDFVVNPAAQTFELWQAVIAWHALIGSTEMAIVLVEEFFPKFLRALCAWLSQDSADLEQIADWYLSWKGRLPAAVEQEPAVRRQLQRVLQVMDRAVSGDTTDMSELAAKYGALRVQPVSDGRARGKRDVSPAASAQGGSRRSHLDTGALGRQSAPAAAAAEAYMAATGVPLRSAMGMGPSAAAAAAAVDAHVARQAPLSVRELVQQMAHENNLVFAPRPGKTAANGQPLYALGGLTIYFDNNVVFAKSAGAPDSSYQPQALSDLQLLAAAG